MATIKKRKNKDGQPRYYIRVFLGKDSSGTNIVKSTTWQPTTKMTETAADKAAEKQAILFEDNARRGVSSSDENTRFEEYATRWMATSEISLKTREQYDYLLVRINQSIGHIKLGKLSPEHLNIFLTNLRKDSARVDSSKAISNTAGELRRTAGMSLEQLAAASGLSAATVGSVCAARRVSLDTAKKFAAALSLPVADLFIVIEDNKPLSGTTVKAHHTLIRAILASAKRERIVPYNIAAEFMKSPKAQKTTPQYLDDVQARQFLEALLQHDDIRIKTALLLDLFTGMRRGELLGLSWSDVDFDKGMIHVERASQYLRNIGVSETATKNDTSIRNIKVDTFVIEHLIKYQIWWMEQKVLNGDAWLGDAKQRLFIQSNGKPLFPDTINYWLSNFLKSNNFPHMSPHKLRHTFATLQLAAGVDIRTLQYRLGHAQASTSLNIYSHFIQSAQDEASDRLASTLLGNNGTTKKAAEP